MDRNKQNFDSKIKIISLKGLPEFLETVRSIAIIIMNFLNLFSAMKEGTKFV